MQDDAAFRPSGPCYRLLGSGITVQATQIELGPRVGQACFHMVNRGPSAAYIFYGATSTAVNSGTATGAPIVGTPQGCLSMPNGASRVFTLTARPFLSVVVETGNAAVDVTPGEGI